METPSCVKDKETFVLRRSELGSFSTSGAPAPWNHGLMKLHKLGFPLRDISDASQSPGHALAKKLNKLFVGYTGKNKHHLSSHSDLTKGFSLVLTQLNCILALLLKMRSNCWNRKWTWIPNGQRKPTFHELRFSAWLDY